MIIDVVTRGHAFLFDNGRFLIVNIRVFVEEVLEVLLESLFPPFLQYAVDHEGKNDYSNSNDSKDDSGVESWVDTDRGLWAFILTAARSRALTVSLTYDPQILHYFLS